MVCYRQKGGGGMERTLACFDFDGTMIRGDSITAYLRLARRRGFVSPLGMAGTGLHTGAYFLGLENGDQVKTHALRFLSRLSQRDRRKLDEDFVRQDLIPRLYPSALAQWKKHQADGCVMLLVSASTDNYMRLIADYLRADGLLCTHVKKDGTVEGNCKGEEKPRRIRSWLSERGIRADWAASFAYGDSKSDLPMLRLTGHPVQVNPKKKLRRAAPEMDAVTWDEPR